MPWLHLEKMGANSELTNDNGDSVAFIHGIQVNRDAFGGSTMRIDFVVTSPNEIEDMLWPAEASDASV